MDVWGFVDKIGKGVIQTTSKSIEFVTDIIQEGLTDEDEFEGSGIADTIWGSWNDNILGEGGAMEGAIGPEGVGGTLIGAIPEEQRKQIKSVITPVFDTMDYLYQNIVDDPLSAAVTVFDGALSSGGEGWDTIFDVDTWTRAFDIAETRSLGQAVALAALTGNPYDDAEVLEARQSGLFNLFSGSIDLFANVALDPLAWAGKPAVLAAKYARNGRFVDAADAGRSFRNPLNLATGADEFVKTGRFKRFEERLDKMADNIDEGLTSRLQSRESLTSEDLSRVDELAGQVYKEFKNLPGMTQELAYSLSRYSGESRSLVARLAMGDTKAMQTIEDAAGAWTKSAQDGGKFTELNKLYDELDELRRRGDEPVDPFSGRDPLQGNVDEINIFNKENEIAVLENQIRRAANEGPAQLPYIDALNVKELQLRNLAKFADEPIDATAANARLDALNQNPNLVTAAADQLVLQVTGGNVGSLAKPLSISMMGNLGYGVSTFVANTPYLGTATSFVGRKLSVFSERVPQNLMNWDDADQSFNQFERMIRDAERVKYKGTSLFDQAKINGDELLGKWARQTSQQGRKNLFDQTVRDLNKGVVKIYGDKVLKGLPDAEKAEMMQFALQKMKGNLDQAQKTLNAQSANARVYGNGSLSFDIAEEGGKTTRRHLQNFTPQQLAQSSLVPRYDLISNLYKKGPLSNAIGDSQKALGELMGVWKKGVLLRPAWPIRVLSDELARSAALVGGIETMRGAMAGFGNLRAQWFARNGEDVMEPVLAQMREALTEKGIDDIDLLDKGQLYERYLNDVVDGSQDAVTKLVRKTIGKEYGTRRTVKRVGALSGVGMWAMGPAGLAAAGMYGLYARKSMQKLAVREVGQNFGYQLRDIAKVQLGDEIEELTRRGADPTDTLSPADAATRVEDLKKAAELLEMQSKILLGGRRIRNTRTGVALNPAAWRQRELLKRERRNLDRVYGKVDEADRSAALVNFDRVGQLMHDARVGGYYMGGYKFANEFGDTPYDVQINKQALTANASNRAVANSINQQTKAAVEKNLTQRVHIKFENYLNDPNSRIFSRGYDDTVNKQWKPTGTGEEWGNEFQEYTRLFWKGTSDEGIVRWLQSDNAARLRDAMPEHMESVDTIRHWVQGTRTEIDNILPTVRVGEVEDIFAPVRNKLARGEDISWNQDIAPLIKKHTQSDIPLGERSVMGGIEEIRGMGNGRFNQFGEIPASSEIIDSIQSAGVYSKAKKGIDNIMQAWGTDTVDNLSRSTVFAGVYRREVARRAQAYRNADGTYTLTPERLKRIEDAARRQGIKETRSLLYDLAERGRFEEMVGTIMPFYGAWQEVITNWAGLAVKNPVFVARGIRYFKALEGEDEEGNKRFIYRLPEGLLDSEIFGMKTFGKLGELGFTSLKLNPTSMSMISAGLPGFGPVVTSLASEAVIKNPGLQDTLDWMLPYGASEGTNVLGRIAQQIEPTFVRRLQGAYFDTAERQKMLAQVAVDLAITYTENGNAMITEEMIDNFSQEAERRTSDLLKVRALAGLAIPMSFSLQSPYHDVIDGYRKKVENEGFDEANDWLLTEKGEEFFALTARRTMIRGVASGTLEGEEKYREHQDFADNHPLLKDFIIGKVGADDVEFEFNYAVYKTEIAEGRRERATPEEILRKPQENRGWAKWSEVRDLVYEELDRRGQQNGSASLRANSNNDLRNLLEAAKAEIRVEYPLWWQAYNAARDPLESAKIVQGFREAVESEDFAYRPEMPQIEEYLDARQMIEEELDRRWKATGDADNASLKSRNNQDLEDLWDAIRTDLRTNPQFSAIFDRYFDSDNIERNTWAVNSQ